MIVCPRCNQENTDVARFCLACGHALDAQPAGAREERKVVTVLFADLVGFTSRSERLDPEDVRALLSPYYSHLREELERHGGTVEKFIGDAVMALFGAPVAHEDDPERAVRAALAIRDWVLEQEEELQVRIAVNTGEVLVSLDARPSEGEGMAAGDVVNTTARLQAAAPVNGVLVGKTTFHATEHVIEYREAEPVTAKGKAEPTPVWVAVQARARFGVDLFEAGRAQLIGRERELDALRDALARARSQPSVQLVTLIGVPGIGKSRLVWELLQIVEADPDLIVWRQGRSLPYGEGVAFWALAEMVKAQAGILESDRGAEAEGKLEATVDGLVSDPDEARWIAGHLRALVGVSQAGLAARDRRSESFAAWRRFVEALAERNPVVLVFEDLHWADEGLLDFVDELVDWARGMPLLVLCTARPELLDQRPGWGGGKANALTVSLPPLGDDETARLLAALMERNVLPAETQASLLARAGGNPLYAEQYVRMLAERGDPDLPLPETVQGIIAARLDALAPEEKTLVQDASVIGKVFWLGALQAIGGMARWDAEHLLHNLERKEFVQRARRASVASEVEFSFRHLLVRDVAYGQIPRAARGEKHRLIAEWLESLGRPEDHAEMLAHHYLNALEYGRAAGRDVEALAGPARTALREAGDRSFALSAFRGAVRLYEQALALWPEDDLERPEILFRYGRSLHMAAEPGEERVTAALGSAREAFLSAGEPDRAAEAEALLAWNVWSAGQRDRAREHLERATGLVGGRPDSASKAIVLAERSRFHMVAEENEDAVRVGREALALAERFGLEELQAHTLNNVGVARTIGGDTGGIGDLERAIGIAERIDSWEVVRAQQNLASVSAALGNLERARELHEAGLVLERERFGATVNIRWMLGELAADLYWAGEWDSALRDIDSFLHDYGIGEHYQEAGCRQIQALILLARDDVEPARADNLRAADLARLAKDPQLLYPVLAMGVFCALEMGFRAEAIETADELLGALAAFPGAASWSPYVGFFAHACVALGRTKELAQALAQASIESPWLTAATAVLSEEPGEAADMYEAIGSIPDEAYARLRAAEVLARAGRRAEADAQLGRALGFYRSVGAARYARQGEALLAASA